MTQDNVHKGSMDVQAPLASQLGQVKHAGSEWQPLYDEFVAKLRDCGVGEGAPAVGDAFPAFGLPNSIGRYTRLEDLLRAGPLVLSFNRGGWCPYCRSELSAWVPELPELRRLGASFAAVTGEVGGRAERLRAELGLQAEMLCDIDHGLALQLGLAFPVDVEVRRRYIEHGLDLAEIYGTASWFLPIPATFVIDRGGILRYAFVDADFRTRAEPEEVVRVVRSLAA